MGAELNLYPNCEREPMIETGLHVSACLLVLCLLVAATALGEEAPKGKLLYESAMDSERA